jgi:hypothetical protein
MHYHAMGDAHDVSSWAAADGRKPRKLRGPVNGACRCEAHASLGPERLRPDCGMDCYICERLRVLAERLVA